MSFVFINHWQILLYSDFRFTLQVIYEIAECCTMLKSKYLTVIFYF